MATETIRSLPSPPPVYSFSAFNKLPNHGIYCISATASKGHKSSFSIAAHTDATQKRSEAKHKRGTLDFLQETLIYIANIRKPQVLEENHASSIHPIRVRRKPRNPPIRPRPVSLHPSYSVKYIGEVEGRLSVLTTRMPLLPSSPKPKATPSTRSEIRLPTPTTLIPKLKGHRWSLDLSATGRLPTATPTEEAPRKDLIPMENFAPRVLPSEGPAEEKVIRWESFADLERHKFSGQRMQPHSRRTATSHY